MFAKLLSGRLCYVWPKSAWHQSLKLLIFLKTSLHKCSVYSVYCYLLALHVGEWNVCLCLDWRGQSQHEVERGLWISNFLTTWTSWEMDFAATSGYFYGKGRMTQRAIPKSTGARSYRELFIGSGTGLGYNQENGPSLGCDLSCREKEENWKGSRKNISYYRWYDCFHTTQSKLSINLKD